MLLFTRERAKSSYEEESAKSSYEEESAKSSYKEESDIYIESFCIIFGLNDGSSVLKLADCRSQRVTLKLIFARSLTSLTVLISQAIYFIALLLPKRQF